MSTPEQPTTDLAIRGNPAAFEKIKETIAAAKELGAVFCKSGMAGCDKDEQGTLLALTCLFERKAPLQLLREQHVMFGRIVMRSDAMLSRFKARAGNKWRWLKLGDDGIEASAEVTTPSDCQTISFRMEDAQRGGYAKRNDSYNKDPGAMLRSRLITKAVRIMDPDVISGAGDEYEASEAAIASQPALTLASTAQAPRVLEAKTEVLPAVAVRVADEMRERAEQPLPADIQPTHETDLQSQPPSGAPTPSAVILPAQAPQSLPTTDATSAAAQPSPTPTQAELPAARPANDSPAGQPDPFLVAFAEIAPDKATAFFRSKGWLSERQTWLDLKTAQISLLKQKPALFQNQLKNFAPKV